MSHVQGARGPSVYNPHRFGDRKPGLGGRSRSSAAISRSKSNVSTRTFTASKFACWQFVSYIISSSVPNGLTSGQPKVTPGFQNKPGLAPGLGARSRSSAEIVRSKSRMHSTARKSDWEVHCPGVVPFMSFIFEADRQAQPRKNFIEQNKAAAKQSKLNIIQ